MLVGQEKLRNHLYTLQKEGNLPRLMIFSGARGQGKSSLAFALAGMMGDIYGPDSLKVNDIRKLIEDAQSLHSTRTYILKDADDMTIQAQNAILKFAEEPTQNAFIIMTVQHENNILPTIKSRGQMYQLEPYTKEQLRKLTDNEALIRICENPGQIKKALEYDFEGLMQSVDKVLDNISRVSVANTFNILKHFDTEDADLLITFILNGYFERLKKATTIEQQWKLNNQIKVVFKYKEQIKNKSINKNNALEIMFVELREASR